MGTQQEESIEQIRQRLEVSEARAQELERTLAGERTAAQLALRETYIREAVRGSADPQVAALVLRGALKEGAGEREISAAAAKLRGEKPYLFGGVPPGASAIPETGPIAGPGGEAESGDSPALRAAAERARASGNRRDLAEYLHVRQSMRQ